MGGFDQEQLKQLDSALAHLRDHVVADVAAAVKAEVEILKLEKLALRSDFEACNANLEALKQERESTSPIVPATRSRTPGDVVESEISRDNQVHPLAEVVGAERLERKMPDDAAESEMNSHDQVLEEDEAKRPQCMLSTLPVEVAAVEPSGDNAPWGSQRSSQSGNSALVKIPGFMRAASRNIPRAQISKEIHEWTKKEQAHQAERAAHLGLAPGDAQKTLAPDSWHRRQAAKVVEAPFFDLAVLGVICLNCVTIGIEVQLYASNPTHDLPLVMRVVDYVIFVVFLAELVLRIAVRGARYFFWSSPTLGWNWLDFVVVSASVFDLVASILLSASGSGTDMTNMRVFRVIKVARILRAMRAARVVRYVSALRMLVYSMVVSLKSVMWALLLFMLIIYVCAVVFTQEVAQSIFDQGGAESGDPRLVYWGSVFASMFTLYKSICGGVDWHDVVTPLQDIHFSLALLFATFIWFMFFCALNVITGVFCSTALSAAANDPEILAMGLQVSKATRHAHALHLFKALDSDNSGEITFHELARHLEDTEVQGLLIAIGVDTTDAVSLFSVLDADKSGLVDKTEFIEGCISLRGNVTNVDFMRSASETRTMIQRLTQMMAALEDWMDRETPATSARGKTQEAKAKLDFGDQISI